MSPATVRFVKSKGLWRAYSTGLHLIGEYRTVGAAIGAVKTKTNGKETRITVYGPHGSKRIVDV